MGALRVDPRRQQWRRGLIGNPFGGLPGGGGSGGGLLTSLVGPGSWLGSALGMSSIIGPPAALAGAGAATGGAGWIMASCAIPGWGWALAAVAAIASRFIGDEKGIKIDKQPDECRESVESS